MRKIFILYENFYTRDGKNISIGGIQNYIKMLIEVIEKNNMIPVVFQFSDSDFQNVYKGHSVYGIAMKSSWSKKKKNKILFNNCRKFYNRESDIIIFASDTMIVKNNEKRVIAIQHGINWDVRHHEHYSNSKNLLYIFWRAIVAYKNINRFRNINVLVGVDYNFLNWYRTQVACIKNNIKIIPNFTNINYNITKPDDDINIIFARRFYKYRGTRLFTSVVKNIMKKFNNVHITIAGSGPDETYMKENLKDYNNVKFIKYDSTNSLEIHQRHHIAVIPSIGSEGTSLSLLEAMASKCAVIATNVGGMTNIIIDNYNGLLINPDKTELYNALEQLINNYSLRKELSEKAYQTVSNAFNKKLWGKRWMEVLREVSK